MLQVMIIICVTYIKYMVLRHALVKELMVYLNIHLKFFYQDQPRFSLPIIFHSQRHVI